MEEEIEWLNGFISARSDKFWFVMVIKHGVSAVLPKTYKDAAFGDFCRVKIRKNPFKKNERAQYRVIDYERIDPLEEYRIDDEGRHVYITTVADVSDFTEYRGKRIAMLSNDTFGTFIDLDGKIEPNAKRVRFEFKSKCSPIDQYLTIFVPVRVLDYMTVAEPPRSRRRSRSRSVGAPRLVKGFVGYENSDFFWVWCKEFDHDVHLHKDFCPDTNMAGKWIEMYVLPERRNRSRVCQKVKIVDDVLECRVVNKVPELFVELSYFEEFDGRYPAFHNTTIGSIVDVDGVSNNVKTGETYSGWIARHKWDETDSRWKLSPKQDTIGSKIRITGFHAPRNRDSSDDETESFISERYSDEDDDMYNYRKEEEKRQINERREQRQYHRDLKDTEIETLNQEDETTSGSTAIGNDSSTPKSNSSSVKFQDNLRLKSILSDFLKCRKVRTEMKSENSEAYDELVEILQTL